MPDFSVTKLGILRHKMKKYKKMNSFKMDLDHSKRLQTVKYQPNEVTSDE